ncbi:MAG TPA: serine/threonine-protein kinase [Kofleriaceae bacterium]|nr:serine/threonine-protein kinase [Kofleriaceae bacterium]
MPTARQDDRAVEAPERFGQYLLHESLGKGSTASVRRGVLCRAAGFRREVALKQLHPHLAELPEMVELFTREARLGSYLRHANIAQTFDFGSFNGTYFIAMELVRGPTLAQLARQCAGAAGPIPMGIVVGILIQLCDAFDYIRSACDPNGQPLQLAHSDVSPTNVVISNTGFVKLIDFGISRAASARPLAETGMLRRRLAHVAPEYAAGKLDARSDLFSLGVIGHELIANQPLFAGSGNELRRVCEMPIPPLARSGTVPHALQDVIMTALQRDPDRRWQTAAEMRSALSDVARGMSIHIGPPQIASWVAWAFSQRARPEGPTPLVVVPASASPAALHARAASEGGAAFQDAPTTLRHGIRMPAGLPSTRSARSRRARQPSASVPTSPAITREFTKRFLRLASLRRRPAAAAASDDEALQRKLAHTVPNGRMAVRLPGVAVDSDQAPDRPPARRRSAAAPIAAIPLAQAPARSLPQAAPAEPAPIPPAARTDAAPRTSEAMRAPAAPATFRTPGAQHAGAAAVPPPAPALPMPSMPRGPSNTTGVVVIPASRRPDRGEHGRRTRMIRSRWRLPRPARPVVFAILAALVAFALAYHWLRL